MFVISQYFGPSLGKTEYSAIYGHTDTCTRHQIQWLLYRLHVLGRGGVWKTSVYVGEVHTSANTCVYYSYSVHVNVEKI